MYTGKFFKAKRTKSTKKTRITRQKNFAPFRFRHAAKAALRSLLLPFPCKPASLGFAWSTKGFVLFALMGKDTSAAQKAKIARKSKAVRCKAVFPERKCVQAMKSTQPILGVSARALKKLGRISARQNRVCPCQLMVGFFSCPASAC